MDLEEYMQYQETQLHEQPGFAYNTYLCTIPNDFSRVTLHWHEQMELVYIKKGSGFVSVNLTSYPVNAGCIIPILPGELHGIECAPNGYMEYENIIFSLSLLDSTAENDWCRQNIIEPLRTGTFSIQRPLLPGSEIHQAASGALDQADAACSKRPSGFSLLVKSELFQFFYSLYRYRPDASVPNPVSDQNTQKMKQLLAYIKEHYAEPITVSDAAHITGYSASHFMRLFHSLTNQTFVSYLNDYRLNAACYFLRETDDAIGTIAAKCGFDNFSYFIRLFRKKTGVTPKDFRRR